MSEHYVKVVQVGDVLPHPNREVERMELTYVGGWACCIGKGQFNPGDRAVYVEPDYVVPTDQAEFSFLAKPGRTRERITVRRFKGTYSQGLLIPLPDSLAGRSVGDNVMADLGIERYEPVVHADTGYANFVGAPSGLYLPKFDVDSYQRYVGLFAPGEAVVVTEKIHGANARYTATPDADGAMQCHAGSRTNWIGTAEPSIWWAAFDQCAAIAKLCVANPGVVVYGEVFGNVQNLKYGATNGRVFFAGFAMLRGHAWLDYDECRRLADVVGLPWVPLVYRGPFDPAAIAAMAEQDSRWPGAKHMAEGVVVTPARERVDERLGRVALKMLSNRYLEKA